MPYQVTLAARQPGPPDAADTPVDAFELPTAAATARLVLERRLGGPLGVEQAYRAWETAATAAADERSSEQRAALERWQRATDAALAEIQRVFGDADPLWIETVTRDLQLRLELCDELAVPPL